MTNRILFDPAGLKISKPGFDVTTTSENGLSFSSDWGGLTILMRGSVAIPTNDQVNTVWLPKVFERPPLTQFILAQDGSNQVAGGFGDLFFFFFILFAARVFNDRLEVTSNADSTGGARFRYVVWDYTT